MLADLRLRPSIPVSDPARAHHFYASTLGLKLLGHGGGGDMFDCNGVLLVLVQQKEAAGKGGYSLLTWLTDDIEAKVDGLRARGVIFEDYDFPGVKTVNGIATLGTDRVAWFKDSEGNLLALAQLG